MTQKTQMKNSNNGRNVTEKLLFHGTDSKYVDVISSVVLGSYFARDAKYSHSYTGVSDVKSMFISRVLVGSYTKGRSSYRRPPSKDGGDINFFDSCVDDVMDPSIFVVFEKHQIYPEYLLQYKTTHPLVSMYGAAAVPVPKPVPAPRPAPQPTVSVYQTSTPSIRPSASVSPPSTSSYRPSTSSYRTTASHYQPSPRFAQPSPSPSPPPMSPKPKKNDTCAIASGQW